MTFGALDYACDEFGPRECGADLYCDVPSGGMATTGTCATRVAVNGACTSSAQCTFGANCRNKICVPAGSDAPVCK